MNAPQCIEHELFRQTSFPVGRVQSLAWCDDHLVDWAGGHIRYDLDGTVHRPVYTPYGPRFDAAIAAFDGRHAVIYERLGTKALLIRDGKMVRELNRSDYCADAYEYPAGFVRLPNGRTGLVHCPNDYCRLEIDDALTDECVTREKPNEPRDPSDVFHSRPAGSPEGQRLLTAGWVWHPWDVVLFCDVAKALEDPRMLDRLQSLPHSLHVGLAEESSAAWLDERRVVIASSAEPEDPQEASEAGNAARLRSKGLAVFDVESGQCESSVVLSEVAGTLMPVGRNHVVSFYEEPKLIALTDGRELYRWKGVFSGTQGSSICLSQKRPIPPLALDGARGRFAVVADDTLVIVEIKGAECC